jgi:hypothetical protein
MPNAELGVFEREWNQPKDMAACAASANVLVP